MSYPLKPAVGDRLFLVHGLFSSQNGRGRPAVVTEVGRLYVTVDGCERFLRKDGASDRGSSFARLWLSESHYLLELERTTALVKLRRQLDALIAGGGPRPSVASTLEAAASLGITLETAE